MLVPLVGFAILWVLGFVKWPNKEGKTRTSVPWIVTGFVTVPLFIWAVIIMSSAIVRQVDTVEQIVRPVPQKGGPRPSQQSPKYLSDGEVGFPAKR